MSKFVVLLRGVNVGGHNRVPMADLKAACEKAGFGNVRTYVNSGNLLVDGKGPPAQVEAKVEGVLKAMKVEVPVVARTADQWATLAASNPFPKAAPKALHLGVSKAKPDPGCATALEARGAGGERVRLVGDALWIDFNQGAGRSKLTPAAIDKAVGSPTTLRNWTTVQKLVEMAQA